LEVDSCVGIGLHFAGELDTAPTAERAWAKRLTEIVNTLNIEIISKIRTP